jgi:hypothetical protein
MAWELAQEPLVQLSDKKKKDGGPQESLLSRTVTESNSKLFQIEGTVLDK